MSKMMSRHTLFGIVVILILLGTIRLIFVLSSDTRVASRSFSLENTIRPSKRDVDVGYSELNLSAPRNVFSGRASSKSIYPELPRLLLKGSPVASKIEVGDFKLVLTNIGTLELSVKNVLVWSSKNPRVYEDCVEMNVLKSFMTRTPTSQWPMLTHAGAFTLHPFAITMSERVVWSIFGGWDASAVCSLSECEIPFPSKTLTSEAFLISPSRAYRAGLLPNGDVVIVTVKGVDEKQVSSLARSLMQDSFMVA